MSTVYFKETTLKNNHILKNTEQPAGSALNPIRVRDELKVEKGEVLPVMVEAHSDGRKYYTLYKIVNNKVYATTTLCQSGPKGIEVLPNTGGLQASQDVKRALKNHRRTPVV